MAIDLEKIKEIHANLSGKGTGGMSDTFLKIEEGTNAVRVLPPKTEDEDFYAMTKLHRMPMADGTVKNIHCRQVHGEQCPICNLYYSLWKEPTKDETLARQIKGRDRYYMNVVDRESGEVKILSIGIILFKKIIAAMVDPDYGDITDAETGHDFKIIKIMEGQWPKYDQSAPRPKSTPAGSAKEVSGWMDSLHDIQSLVKLEDYEELKQLADSTNPFAAVERSADDIRRSETEVGDEDYMEKLQS
jgi:hypothetical protein